MNLEMQKRFAYSHLIWHRCFCCAGPTTHVLATTWLSTSPEKPKLVQHFRMRDLLLLATTAYIMSVGWISFHLVDLGHILNCGDQLVH